MPPVPAALLLPLPRLPRRALLLRPAARCAHSLRLLLLEVDGLGVGVLDLGGGDTSNGNQVEVSSNAIVLAAVVVTRLHNPPCFHSH